MNISPLKAIPVSYSVLPTDVTAYFVQAVLRDTATSATLQTINLTQNVSVPYRYTGVFKPVSDPSGLGRYIDITVIPYTDSGHTTPSQNYAALQLNYVVLQPWIPSLGAGGGGSIDYDKLRLTIAEVILEQKESPVESVTVEYDRIGNDMREALEEASANISGTIGNGSKSTGSLLALIEKRLTENSSNASVQLMERIEHLEDVIAQSSKTGASSSKSLRESLESRLAESREELIKIHANHSRKIDMRLEESSASSLASLKSYMDENLSNKEIQFKFGEVPKEKKDSQPVYDPIVNRILRIP